MKYLFLLIFSILFFSNCKEEQTSNRECNLTYSSTVSRNWNFQNASLGIPATRQDVELIINTDYDYTFNYKIMFFDSLQQVVDSTIGNEIGKIELDYCHSNPSGANNKPYPGVFWDEGDITFLPEGKENYTTTFEQDKFHFLIHDMKLDTFTVWVGFAN